MMERSNLSLMETKEKNARELGDVTTYEDLHAYLSFREPVLQGLIIFICTAGLVEAGVFIWSLGFCIKKATPVVTYFLNLAVADFGLLTFLLVLAGLGLAQEAPKYKMAAVYLLLFAHVTTLCFLTAASVERGLLVWFPVWHRCHRPSRTSSIASFLIWSTAGFLTGLTMLFHYIGSYHHSVTMIGIICSGNVLLLIPLVVVSSLIALICNHSQKHLPRILHVNRFLRLVCYIFFAMPVSYFYFIDCLGYTLPAIYMWIFFLLASLNSMVNPLIHYVLGGQWKRWR